MKLSRPTIAIINSPQDENAEWQEHVLVDEHRLPIWGEEESCFPIKRKSKKFIKF